MSEIWNLNTLCRCCHADGHFKSLNLMYQGKRSVEIYENMLRDTLGIIITRPQLEASYTVCEDCITKLRDATEFKTQVLACEQKFLVYCENEQFLSNPEVKIEVDAETNSCYSNDDHDVHYDDDDDDKDESKDMIEISTEAIKQEDTIKMDSSDNVEELKEEKPEKQFEVPVINASEEHKPLKVDEKTKKDTKIPVKKKRQKITINKKDTKIPVKKKRQKITINKEAEISHPYIIKENIGNTRKYSCKECGESFNELRLINTHLQNDHSCVYKCNYCPHVLPNYNRFVNHVKFHIINNDKDIQCPKCPRTFTKKEIFHDHLWVHAQFDKCICDICQKEFRMRSLLGKHLRIHSGKVKPILCDICGWGFNDTTNLKIHIDTVHLRLKPFECKICKMTFPVNKRLKQHMKKIHIENKPVICRQESNFKCPMCPEVFDTRKARKDHVYAMHGSKYKCPICDKMLSDQYCLERHIELHNGIRNFTCEICGEKFAQKSILKRHHFRRHNPDMELNVVKTKCEICKRGFKNIKVHMERHRVRNYACDICGEKFALNSSLKRHKDQKHFGKYLSCEVCNKKYLHRTKLNTHMFKAHNIKVEKKDKAIIANFSRKCFEKTG